MPQRRCACAQWKVVTLDDVGAAAQHRQRGRQRHVLQAVQVRVGEIEREAVAHDLLYLLLSTCSSHAWRGPARMSSINSSFSTSCKRQC